MKVATVAARSGAKVIVKQGIKHGARKAVKRAMRLGMKLLSRERVKAYMKTYCKKKIKRAIKSECKKKINRAIKSEFKKILKEEKAKAREDHENMLGEATGCDMNELKGLPKVQLIELGLQQSLKHHRKTVNDLKVLQSRLMAVILHHLPQA